MSKVITSIILTGTNYIVAVLLSNISSQRYCFWTFVQLMNDKNWRYLYLNNTPKLLHMLELLVKKIQKEIPDLYNHFSRQDVFTKNKKLQFLSQAPGVFTHYFATMFSYNISIDYANRVFDLFWLESENVIYDCLIHLLKLKKRKLMEMCMEVIKKNSNLQEMFVYIKGKLVNDCINEYGIEKSLPYESPLQEKEIKIV